MKLKPAAALMYAALLTVLASCGSDSLLLSMGRGTSDLQINSLADGQVVPAGTSIPLQISSRTADTHKDLEMEVSLASPEGRSVWKSARIASPALNEDLPLQLPDLPTGQYLLEIVLYSGGEQVSKKTCTFFITRDSYTISGIKSFPPVITSGSTVLLRAELTVPRAADAYLRWSWKGTAFARGLLSAGSAEVLWTAPAEEGVYSIHLELFPGAPPAGADFPFSSSIVLSTDLYVTAGTRLARGDLSPAQSYLSLLHMQGSLKDEGTAAGRQDRAAATAIGSPQIQQVDDGFGYRLDGRSGIAIPWFVLPIEGGVLKPFTVSIGITAGSLEAESRLLAITSADEGFSLVITMDPTARGPRALLAAAGGPGLSIPWAGPALQVDRRALLSLSVLPQGKSFEAAWFLDGAPVSRLSAEAALTDLKAEGRTVIGGENGFVGVVDEFGVFYRDEQGRPSIDPGLFARAALASHGDALVLAEGFDGPFLPKGFSASGVEIAAGTLVVPAGAAVDLPPVVIAADDVGYTVGLAPKSAAGALLELAWEGSSDVAAAIPLVAESGSIAFTITAGAEAVLLPGAGREKSVRIPPAADRGAGLVLRVSQAKDAKAPLVIESILAARAKP